MKKTSLFTLVIFVLLSCGQAKTSNTLDNKNQVKQESNTEIKKDTLFDFENYNLNILPKDWEQSYTGKGTGTEWKIVDDSGNKVMAQLSKNNPNYHFNNLVFNNLEAKNIRLSVKIKAVSGKMDQGGGFVWRYTDKDNYYVVRANPLENNVVLYKVKNGVRTDLPVMGKGRTYGVDVPDLGNDWFLLSVDVQGDMFVVYLNGKEIFKVKDETFKEKGKFGFWTKADAVSYFDDFKVEIYE